MDREEQRRRYEANYQAELDKLNPPRQAIPTTPQPAQPKGFDFGKELGSAIDAYQASLWSIPAALGSETALKRMQENQALSEQQAAQSAAPKSWEEMQFGKDFLPYVGHLATQSLPYMGEAMAGMAIGAGLGTGAGPVGTAAGAVGGFFGRKALRGIAEEEARTLAAKRLGGAMLGGAAASYPSSVGDILTNQYDQAGEFNLPYAAAGGVPYAALNMLGGEAAIARGIFGAPSEAAGKHLLTRMASSATRAAVGAAPIEALGETGQELINQMGRAVVDSDYSIMSPQAIAAYKESAIAGGLLGGIMGGVGGGIEGIRGHAPAPIQMRDITPAGWEGGYTPAFAEAPPVQPQIIPAAQTEVPAAVRDTILRVAEQGSDSEKATLLGLLKDSPYVDFAAQVLAPEGPVTVQPEDVAGPQTPPGFYGTDLFGGPDYKTIQAQRREEMAAKKRPPLTLEPTESGREMIPAPEPRPVAAPAPVEAVKPKGVRQSLWDSVSTATSQEQVVNTVRDTKGIGAKVKASNFEAIQNSDWFKSLPRTAEPQTMSDTGAQTQAEYNAYLDKTAAGEQPRGQVPATQAELPLTMPAEPAPKQPKRIGKKAAREQADLYTHELPFGETTMAPPQKAEIAKPKAEAVVPKSAPAPKAPPKQARMPEHPQPGFKPAKAKLAAAPEITKNEDGTYSIKAVDAEGKAVAPDITERTYRSERVAKIQANRISRIHELAPAKAATAEKAKGKPKTEPRTVDEVTESDLYGGEIEEETPLDLESISRALDEAEAEEVDNGLDKHDAKLTGKGQLAAKPIPKAKKKAKPRDLKDPALRGLTGLLDGYIDPEYFKNRFTLILGKGEGKKERTLRMDDKVGLARARRVRKWLLEAYGEAKTNELAGAFEHLATLSTDLDKKTRQLAGDHHLYLEMDEVTGDVTVHTNRHEKRDYQPDQAAIDYVVGEITDLRNQLTKAYAALDALAGVDNIAAAQFLSKKIAHNVTRTTDVTLKAGRQGALATRFSMYYADYKRGNLARDIVSSGKIRFESHYDKRVAQPLQEANQVAKGSIDPNSRFGELFAGKGLKEKVRATELNKAKTALGDTATPYELSVGAGWGNFLTHVKVTNKSASTRLIADHLHKLMGKSGFLYTIKLLHYPKAPTGGGASATYEPATNTIRIYGAGTNVESVLHELFHAATSNYIKSNPTSDATVAMLSIIDDINKHIAAVGADNIPGGETLMKVFNDPSIAPYELVSYALTNSTVQSLMRETKTSKKTQSLMKQLRLDYAPMSMWDGLIRILKSIFSLGSVKNSAMSQFMDAYHVMSVDIANDAKVNGSQAFEWKHGNEVKFRQEAILALGGPLQDAVREKVKNMPYSRIDAMMRGLFNMVGINEQKGQERWEAMGKRVTDFASRNPTWGNILRQYIDNFGVPSELVPIIRTSESAANIVDAQVFEALDKLGGKVLDLENNKAAEAYLNGEIDGKGLDPELKRLIDLYTGPLMEQAKALGIIPKHLMNASPRELIKWSSRTQKFNRGFMHGEFSPYASGKHMMKSVKLAGDNPLNSIRSGNSEKYIRYSKAGDADVMVAEDVATPAYIAANLPGYEAEKTDQFYRRKGEQPIFERPLSLNEGMKLHNSSSLIRSIAATAQEVGHRVAGHQFADGLIKMNEALPEDAKWVVDKTPKEFDKTAPNGSLENPFDSSDLPRADVLKARAPGAWIYIPDTRFTRDTYGPMAGKTVAASVYWSMYDYNNRKPIMPEGWRNTMRWWKKYKVVYSPVAWVNNIASSFMMAYYHDIPVGNLQRAFKTLVAVEYGRFGGSTPEQRMVMDKFKQSGAVLANFIHGEFFQDLVAKLDKETKDVGETNSMQDLMHFSVKWTNAASEWYSNKVDSPMANFYANQDNVFRLAAFLTRLEQIDPAGINTTDITNIQRAGEFAADSMVNYNINAPGINKLRETVLPFAAWPYRVVGMLAKLAVTKPWKLANTMAAMYTVNLAAYAILGADADEDDERKYLPDYMQGRVWGIGPHQYVRLPFGGEGKGTWLGLGRMVPNADIADINQGSILPQAVTPGGPAVIALAALMGYDPFLQKTLRAEENTFAENTASTIGYAARALGPTIGGKTVDFYDKAIAGKKGPLGSEANGFIELAKLSGFTVRETDNAEQVYSYYKNLENLQRKLQQKVGKAVRADMRYENPDWDELLGIQQDATDRMLEEYANG